MDNDLKEIKSQLKSQSFGYILTAFGLVAGLAWNDAISAFLKMLFPIDNNALIPKFIYAIVVTIAVVLISKALIKVSGSKE